MNRGVLVGEERVIGVGLYLKAFEVVSVKM